MQPVTDILYLKGRRKERLIAEVEEKRDKRAIATALFKRYQKNDTYYKNIQEWAMAQCSWGNRSENPANIIVDDMDALEQSMVRKELGLHSVKPEISLEDKLLSAMRDGWILKGETYWDNSGFGIQMLIKFGPQAQATTLPLAS